MFGQSSLLCANFNVQEFTDDTVYINYIYQFCNTFNHLSLNKNKLQPYKITLPKIHPLFLELN